MIKVPADSVAGEDLLPGSLTAIFSLCPHMAERARELCGGLCGMGTNPIHEGSSPNLQHHHIGDSVSAYEFEGDTNIQSSAPYVLYTVLIMEIGQTSAILTPSLVKPVPVAP